MISAPLVIMEKLGLDPDPWQLEVLGGTHRRLLLNCSRQAGKSTVVALLSLMTAVQEAASTVLLLSPSQRQSGEIYQRVRGFARRLGKGRVRRGTRYELELHNESRVVSLPCSPDTIRGYSGVRLLVIDEAARVPDELYWSVRPMLAASDGRLACLSTPRGRRGFFYQAWAQGGEEWTRFMVAADRVPRIRPEFLEEERRSLGEAWFRQEYFCSFEAVEGVVYPEFESRTRAAPPAPAGRPVGGIDFGFRNPFAAVWGLLDRDGLLWLTGEHYQRMQPLGVHARALPRDVTWYADPAGAGDIAELRRAGLVVRRGKNAVRPGIMAVTARLNTGRLRVLAGACPNLLREASLYRWSGTEETEEPVDEHNHALAALRYLVASLDAGRLALEPRQ